MKRLVAALALLLAASLVGSPAAPAAAPARAGGIDWGLSNWVAGVQMTTSSPSATDRQLHVRFKRVGGEGQRQVRMGERAKREGTHQWTPYAFTEAVKLAVGEKVVFTTVNALVCEPGKDPVGVRLDLRIKPPGKPWGRWETWVSEDDYLLDCTQDVRGTP
jgi:hypothetical protein